MDEDDIYICFPGELVVYQPHAVDDQNAGLLYTVKGIKSGKVELLICPNNNTSILVHPNDLVECGEYGSDLFDVKDEVSSLYDSYDDSASMDVEGPPDESACSAVQMPDVEIEDAMFYYFRKEYVQACDFFNSVSESTAGIKSLYLAKCMEKLGDFERALHYLMDSYHATGGISAYKACCISICFQKVDNAGEAWSWCQRALQSNPQSPLPHYIAARLLYLEPETRRSECIAQIQSCVKHCTVLDVEQFPSEALEMWCDISELAEKLQCDSSVRIRAWLRAIGVCRSAGILTPPAVPSVHLTNSRRTAEAAAMRPDACRALHELGRLLETSRPSAQSTQPARSTSSSRMSTSGSGKNRMQIISTGSGNARATTTCSSQSGVPVGWGYVRGAYAAHFMCNEVGGGTNREHRKALTNIQSILATMSK